MRPRHGERTSARHTDAVILFSVGENAFAISATAVDEIRNTDGLQPIRARQIGYRKVTHLLARDGKTYCVVDGNAHFGILPSRTTRLLVLRNSSVAVLVARIDRMTELSGMHALPQAFAGEERNWYQGLAVLGEGTTEEVVPVVNPQAFLSREEAQSVLAEAAGVASR